MPKMADRIQETTTTGGTGTITLAGAVTGYRTFAAGFTTGDTLFYVIDDGIGSWEIGIGVLVTTGTLSRTTVIASSNSGALVNFSSGTKRVFCSAPTRSLVPDQDSKSGYVLTTDGTNPSWTQTLNSITIGNTTPASGAFTTLSASSTVSGTGFSNYLASPPAIGGSSPAAGSFTTLTTSSTVTLNGGTANGVGYLNASKVLTTGSALTYNGTGFGVGVASASFALDVGGSDGTNIALRSTGTTAAKFRAYVNGAESGVIGFLNGGGQFFEVAGSEQMRLTSTGLGIGTSSPGSGLAIDKPYSVDTDGAASKWTARFKDTSSYGVGKGGSLLFTGVKSSGGSGGNYAGIAGLKENATDNNEQGYLALYTTPATGVITERLRLDSSGNLGLGVTPSAWAPYRAFQLGLSGAIFGDAGSRNVFVSNNLYYTGSQFAYLLTGPASYYHQANTGQHGWYTAPSGTAGSTISFTQAMTLTAAGDLGIGTASPGAKLHVAGETLLQPTSASNAKLSMRHGSIGSNNYIEVDVSANTIFGTNNAERARITSTGNLLVGDTSTLGGAKAYVLAQSGSNGWTTKVLNNDNVLFNGYNASGSQVFYVAGGGAIYSTSTTITAISDQRLKENIRDLDDGLSTLLKLKPRKFDWKEGKGKDIKNDRGFIAQEFEGVFPDLIDTWKDEPPVGEEPYKAVRADLIPVLVKSIQELSARLEILENKVN